MGPDFGFGNNMASSSSNVLRVAKLSANATLPVRGSPLAAGYDLASAHDVTVPAKGKALAKTDLAIAVPEGTYGGLHRGLGLRGSTLSTWEREWWTPTTAGTSGLCCTTTRTSTLRSRPETESHSLCSRRSQRQTWSNSSRSTRPTAEPADLARLALPLPPPRLPNKRSPDLL